MPVMSPLPFRLNVAAKTGSQFPFGRGRIAVTPVRIGPLPGTSTPSPWMIVAWPTAMPATSVIALFGPGLAGERDAEGAASWAGLLRCRGHGGGENRDYEDAK